MAEVVDAELLLEPVDRLATGDRHDAGVVHEQVDRLVLVPERRGAGAHRGERGEVDRRARIGPVGRPLGHGVEGAGETVGIPAGEHHVGALRAERDGRLEAEAAVRPGHDRDPSRLVDDVGRRPTAAHAVVRPASTAIVAASARSRDERPTSTW